jgi:cell division protein FtsQ
MWLKIGLAVIALMAVAAGAIALYASDTFTITEVKVEGAGQMAEDEITEVAALPPRSTLLRYPKAEMEARLKDHPWISDAHISRRLPHTIIIHVEERTPVALIDVGEEQFWLVDSAGMALGQRTPDATETLTVVRDLANYSPVAGEQADSVALTNALAVIAGLSDELRGQVRAVSAPSADLTTLITDKDVEILVGSAEDIEKKDTVAREILAEQGGKVVHINVRTVDRPTWRGLDSAQ